MLNIFRVKRVTEITVTELQRGGGDFRRFMGGNEKLQFIG